MIHIKEDVRLLKKYDLIDFETKPSKKDEDEEGFITELANDLLN